MSTDHWSLITPTPPPSARRSRSALVQAVVRWEKVIVPGAFLCAGVSAVHSSTRRASSKALTPSPQPLHLPTAPRGKGVRPGRLFWRQPNLLQPCLGPPSGSSTRSIEPAQSSSRTHHFTPQSKGGIPSLPLSWDVQIRPNTGCRCTDPPFQTEIFFFLIWIRSCEPCWIWGPVKDGHAIRCFGGTIEQAILTEAGTGRAAVGPGTVDRRVRLQGPDETWVKAWPGRRHGMFLGGRV